MVGYSIHQEGLRIDYFGHLTPAKLCGRPTLWYLDLHMISDLVRAIPRIIRCCHSINHFYPHFVSIDLVSMCSWWVIHCLCEWHYANRWTPGWDWFLDATCFIGLWHHSAMLFPPGMYVLWNHKLIPQSCMKPLLQKAVSLSVLDGLVGRDFLYVSDIYKLSANI